MTGGIGAGKSTALAALKRLGAAVLSTDQVVHELYETPEVRDAVVERFGPTVASNGAIDRPALARAAFAQAEDRAWLEQLLWPRVGTRIAEWRAHLEAQSPGPCVAVVEVPLLFESGMETAFDATIAIVAEEETRADRAGGRGHEALAERGNRQLSQQEKAQRATYVVTNDGSLEDLETLLSGILAMLAT